MGYVGEIISLGVACSWTVAALASEVASKKLGVFVMNVWRMALALLFSAILIWIFTGYPYPAFAKFDTWAWLLASGVVGYFFGDWCLFNSYLTIGSRFGQLFMTLAPAFTALCAWVMIGQMLSWQSLLAMAITLSGIAVSVLGHDSQHHFGVQLPLKGILFGLGAALGQGVGLVLSKMGIQAYDQHLKAMLNDLIDGGQYAGNHWDLEAAMSYMPYAATFIRALTGVVGFAVVLTIVRQWPKVWKGLHDRQAMRLTMGAVVCGPTIGVSLSLLATLYTSTGVAQTLMSLTPIIILLPAWLWQHQRVTRWEVIGAIIAVAGAALFFV